MSGSCFLSDFHAKCMISQLGQADQRLIVMIAGPLGQCFLRLKSREVRRYRKVADFRTQISKFNGAPLQRLTMDLKPLASRSLRAAVADLLSEYGPTWTR